MSKVNKGYHCAYQTHFHIVFPVKYRRALLDERVTSTLKEVATGLQERYEVELERVGCDINHIHLLISLHPKYSQGSFVRIFKSVTAKELFKRIPELKKDLWGGEFWSDGYYVATVGERGDWSVVEKYIREQGMDPQQVQLRLL
jgi:putative transposase